MDSNQRRSTRFVVRDEQREVEFSARDQSASGLLHDISSGGFLVDFGPLEKISADHGFLSVDNQLEPVAIRHQRSSDGHLLVGLERGIATSAVYAAFEEQTDGALCRGDQGERRSAVLYVFAVVIGIAAVVVACVPFGRIEWATLGPANPTPAAAEGTSDRQPDEDDFLRAMVQRLPRRDTTGNRPAESSPAGRSASAATTVPRGRASSSDAGAPPPAAISRDFSNSVTPTRFPHALESLSFDQLELIRQSWNGSPVQFTVQAGPRHIPLILTADRFERLCQATAADPAKFERFVVVVQCFVEENPQLFLSSGRVTTQAFVLPESLIPSP
jgi:hypothetical protein